jgi:hypothetical protein
MAQATTRTHFHSSRLIRILADLALLETTGQGPALAGKLGLWVDYTDAIRLCAVHNAGMPALAALPPTASAEATESAADAVARVRTGLEATIARNGVPVEPGVDYEPYRRFYLAQQRELEQKVGPLRALAREALSQASPALGQLAALDAALDGILEEREARLLGTLPILLRRRFAVLLKGHQQALADSPQANAPSDTPAHWLQPGGWLARFANELQTVLLAELDLRLQPTLGLLEALHHKTPQHA